jgi:hypothetical protein
VGVLLSLTVVVLIAIVGVATKTVQMKNLKKLVSYEKHGKSINKSCK